MLLSVDDCVVDVLVVSIPVSVDEQGNRSWSSSCSSDNDNSESDCISANGAVSMIGFSHCSLGACDSRNNSLTSLRSSSQGKMQTFLESVIVDQFLNSGTVRLHPTTL